MSTISELFAPKFLERRADDRRIEARMARNLGADSLRYLPVEAIARAIGFAARGPLPGLHHGQYPTPCGQQLAQVAKDNFRNQRRRRAHLRSGGPDRLAAIPLLGTVA